MLRRNKTFEHTYEWGRWQVQSENEARELLKEVSMALENEASLQRRMAIQQWQIECENPAAQRKWIKGVETEEMRQARFNHGEDPDPQTKVQAAAAEWQDIWAWDHPADTGPDTWDEVVAQLTPWVPPQTTTPQVHFNPGFLRKLATANKSKAAGPDGWSNKAVMALPHEWWQLFARLCQRVFDTGKVPRMWALARVVLLDKPQGGTRPLSIASTAWPIRMHERHDTVDQSMGSSMDVQGHPRKSRRWSAPDGRGSAGGNPPGTHFCGAKPFKSL
jgi:hypothetical protein